MVDKVAALWLLSSAINDFVVRHFNHHRHAMVQEKRTELRYSI
jgi:hypothetical protein